MRTKVRLLKEADEANGWRLKKKEEEVSRVKKGTEAKFQRLKQKKANLKSEVEAVKVSYKEGLEKSKARYIEKLQDITAKGKEDISSMKAQQRTITKKLIRDKDVLREHAKKQRTESKERVITVQAKRQAAEVHCSELEVEGQKMARDLVARQMKIGILEAEGERTVENMQTLTLDLEAKEKELALTRREVETCGVRDKALLRQTSKDAKKVDKLASTLKSSRMMVYRLKTALSEEQMVKQFSFFILFLSYRYLTSPFVSSFLRSEKVKSRRRG